MHPPTSRHLFFFLSILVTCATANTLPQSNANVDGFRDSSTAEIVNTTDRSATLSVSSEAKLLYDFKPQLGQLKGTPLFITTINCLCHIALGSFETFQASRSYTYSPYEKDVEIIVDGQWGRKPGKPGKWRAKYVLDAILELMRQMAIQKRLEGVVGEVSLLPGDKLEAKITFQDPSRRNQALSGDPVLSLQGNGTVKQANVTIGDPGIIANAIPWSEDDIKDYRNWEMIDSSTLSDALTVNQTRLSTSDPRKLEFYVKFHGPEILAPDWFIAVAEGIRAYADRDGSTMASEVDKDIASFTTHLKMGQYSQTFQRRDHIMMRWQAIRGLLVWPPYALKNRKFQESTMVIENSKGQAIGVFKITKQGAPSTDGAIVQIS